MHAIHMDAVFVTCIVIGVINVDKTKVMASDGIAYRILIQNELLKQVDTFPYSRW